MTKNRKSKTRFTKFPDDVGASTTRPGKHFFPASARPPTAIFHLSDDDYHAIGVCTVIAPELNSGLGIGLDSDIVNKEDVASDIDVIIPNDVLSRDLQALNCPSLVHAGAVGLNSVATLNPISPLADLAHATGSGPQPVCIIASDKTATVVSSTLAASPLTSDVPNSPIAMSTPAPCNPSGQQPSVSTALASSSRPVCSIASPSVRAASIVGDSSSDDSLFSLYSKEDTWIHEPTQMRKKHNYLIIVDHFDKFTPIVSVPIYPKAKLYLEDPPRKPLLQNNPCYSPQYVWYRSHTFHNASDAVICDNTSYTPNNEDVGYFIHLKVSFRVQSWGKNEMEETVMEERVLQSAKVEAQIKLPLWTNRNTTWVENLRRDTGDTDIIVYSHNLMADTYQTPITSDNDFNLNWVNRLDYTINEVQKIKPDILLLQEVEEHMLNKHVKLKLQGYYFYFIEKKHRYKEFDNVQEGLALGVRDANFSILDQKLIDFPTEFTELNMNNLDSDIYGKANVSIVVKLKHKITNKIIYVANVHFSSNDSRARMFQAAILCKLVKGLEGYNEDSSPLIIGGDFNSNPKRDVQRTLRCVNSLSNGADPYAPYSDLKMISKFIPMTSAYGSFSQKPGEADRLYKQDQSEPYTYYCKRQEIVATKDYIMWKNVSCIGLLEMFSKRQLLEYHLLSSDHVSIAAKFKYN